MEVFRGLRSDATNLVIMAVISATSQKSEENCINSRLPQRASRRHLYRRRSGKEEPFASVVDVLSRHVHRCR